MRKGDAMDTATLQNLLDQNARMVIYRADTDPNTPEPGPYRIQLGIFPITPGKTVIVASGATLDDAIADFESVDFSTVLEKLQ